MAWNRWAKRKSSSWTSRHVRDRSNIPLDGLELDLPALTFGELILGRVRRTSGRDEAKAIAAKAQPKRFLGSREVELVDVSRLKMPVAGRLATGIAPMLEAHDRTLTPPGPKRPQPLVGARPARETASERRYQE
jgi:hypothetical protein